MNQAPRASPPPRLPRGDDGTGSEHESPASRLLTVRSAKPRRYPCPYCGSEESSTTNLWRHKAAKCEKNPNPACDYCGWRYKPGELERHMQRCDYRDNPREPAPRGRADPDDAEAAEVEADETQRAPARNARPRTPARAKPEPEEEVTPDDAEPKTSTARGASPPRHRGAARRRAFLSSSPAKPPKPPAYLPLDPVLGTLALNAEELARGLAIAQPRRLAAPREPAPVVTLAPGPAPSRPGGLVGIWREHMDKVVVEDLHARLLKLHKLGLVPRPRSPNDDPWGRFLDMAGERLSPEQMDDLMAMTGEWPELAKVVIGVTCVPPSPKAREIDPVGCALVGAAIMGGVWLLWEILTTPDPTQAAPIAAAAPAQPQYRPPYNSAKWESLEHYLAEVGHLAAPPSLVDRKGRDVVGLDRREGGG